MGILDLTVCFLTIILGFLGVIKNDITERKKEAEEIERKRRLIEEQIASDNFNRKGLREAAEVKNDFSINAHN